MKKATDIINHYALSRHPEGGWYREIFRSSTSVGTPEGYPGDRCALTVIYFLLEKNDFSAFHRVKSDETWIHLSGAPLKLIKLGAELHEVTLGRVEEGNAPLHVVPGGTLQAARSLGKYSFVSCCVAPGFDFSDFEMPGRKELIKLYPKQREVIEEFTR